MKATRLFHNSARQLGVTMRPDTTARLAKELWTEESLRIPPNEFQARFDSIYRSAEGIATFWLLGGAANDFLRHHPGMIQVPEELAPMLLASSMVDGRIIGLKLLNRCCGDRQAIVAAVTLALQSNRESELYGGLCELGEFLRSGRKCESPAVHELLRMLSQLQEHRDQYVRENAVRYVDWIQSAAESSQ